MKTTYPFNSTNGDRKYNADDIAAERAVYFSDGIIVYGGNVIGTELQVEAVTGMTVKVKYGMANIKGRTIKIEAPDEGETEVVLSAANLTNPRIDRIVLEMNLTDPVRDIVIKAIAGTPAASPAAPALTRTAEIWQLSLARVAVPANSASIGAITDERSDSSICGVSNVIVGITPPTGMDAITVELETSTASLFSGGITKVDPALVKVLGYSGANASFNALVTNANVGAVDCALGKGRIDGEIYGIGQALAWYAWYKGDSRVTYPFTNLVKCQTLLQCFNTPLAMAEIRANTNLVNLLMGNTYAYGIVAGSGALPEIVVFDIAAGASPYYTGVTPVTGVTVAYAGATGVTFGLSGAAQSGIGFASFTLTGGKSTALYKYAKITMDATDFNGGSYYWRPMVGNIECGLAYGTAQPMLVPISALAPTNIVQAGAKTYNNGSLTRKMTRLSLLAQV